MVLVELVCERCGETFYRNHWDIKRDRVFCSQQCWLKKHNSPERNAQVARDTAKQRADTLRDTGYKDTYRKVDGRHEHRTVMEQKLGRKLLPGEIVHHKDEDKKNNHPDNLEVKTRSQHAKDHAMHGYRYVERLETECETCDKNFELNTYQRTKYRRGQINFYCSRECYLKRW